MSKLRLAKNGFTFGITNFTFGKAPFLLVQRLPF
jgi:hypothetical protein